MPFKRDDFLFLFFSPVMLVKPPPMLVTETLDRASTPVEKDPELASPPLAEAKGGLVVFGFWTCLILVRATKLFVLVTFLMSFFGSVSKPIFGFLLNEAAERGYYWVSFALLYWF